MIETFYFLKTFLTSVNGVISFYIMPDYSHGIFNLIIVVDSLTRRSFTSYDYITGL